MTLAVMEAFGVAVANHEFRRFEVRPARYRGRTYAIEPDASAASYFFALAAITGGEITASRPGHHELPGGHGVRRRPGADGLLGRPRADEDDASRAVRFVRSTST